MRSIVFGVLVGVGWFILSGSMIGGFFGAYATVALLKALVWRGAKDQGFGHLLPDGIRRSALISAVFWPLFVIPDGDPVRTVYETMQDTTHRKSSPNGGTDQDLITEANRTVNEIEYAYPIPTVREILAGVRYVLGHRKAEFLSIVKQDSDRTAREWVYSTTHGCPAINL